MRRFTVFTSRNDRNTVLIQADASALAGLADYLARSIKIRAPKELASERFRGTPSAVELLKAVLLANQGRRLLTGEEASLLRQHVGFFEDQQWAYEEAWPPATTE